MSKISELFNYMRQCPQLNNLWSIIGEIEEGSQIIYPRGSSPVYEMVNEGFDVTEAYNGVMMPYPSVFEDFQINMVQTADPNDDSYEADNVNIMSYQEVEDVCKWVFEQNCRRNLPQLQGLKVISVETTGTAPVVWSSDEKNQLIVYAITLRLRYVNPYPRVDIAL